MKNESTFFSQIGKVLHSYEETYVPGAWEEFCSMHKRRRTGIFVYRLIGAAAMLFLCSGIVLLFFSKTPKPGKSGQVKNAHWLNASPLVRDTAGIGSCTLALNKRIPQQTAYAYHSGRMGQAKALNADQRSDSTQKDSISIFMAETSKNEKQNNLNGGDKQGNMSDTSFTNFLSIDVPARLTSKAAIKKARMLNDLFADSLLNRQADKPVNKDRNLFYGIVLSPSMGNQKFNFGTGLEISYKIAGNLFLNSGISYASIHASSSGNDGGSPSPSKQLQGAKLDISGFEIPFGLQYKAQGGFYATAGIVGMTVVSNHFEFNYLTQRTETMTVVDGGGNPQQVIRVVSEQQKEQSHEKIASYLGFYTISFGQKKIVGKNQINFGPFINIPFGPVSSENIRFMQGGIRLGFDF